MTGRAFPLLEVSIERDLPRPYLVTQDGEPVRSYNSLAAAWDHAIWQPLNAAGLVPVTGKGTDPGFASIHSRGTRTFFTDDPRYAQAVPREGASPESVERARMAAAKFIQRQLQANPLEDEPLTDSAPVHSPAPASTDAESDDFEAMLQPDDGDWSPEEVPDNDLPGAWSKSDFMGGDPDERSYAEREAESAPDNPEDRPGEPESEAVDTSPVNDLEAAREAHDDSQGESTTSHDEARARLSDSERVTFDNYRHLAENADTESARAFWRGMFEEFAGVPF